MSGMFYPRTLKSSWYITDVCDHIYNQLEGASRLLPPVKENRERVAYLDTFSTCVDLCKKHDMDPKQMLEALIAFKGDLGYYPQPWALWLEGWFYHSDTFRVKAVDDCIEIVKSANRFLLQ